MFLVIQMMMICGFVLMTLGGTAYGFWLFFVVVAATPASSDGSPRSFGELAARLGLRVVDGDPSADPFAEQSWISIAQQQHVAGIRCVGQRDGRAIEVVHDVRIEHGQYEQTTRRDCRLSVAAATHAQLEIRPRGHPATHPTAPTPTGDAATDAVLDVRSDDPSVVHALRPWISAIAALGVAHVLLERGRVSLLDPYGSAVVARYGERYLPLLVQLAMQLEAFEVEGVPIEV
jgi:hypothetical protein